MNNFFLRIEIAIVAFLIFLMPWAESLGLGFTYARLTVNHTQIAAEVVAAINTKDVEKLQSMMCLNIKDNVNDLPTKISDFCDAVLTVTDGKLTDSPLDIRKDVVRLTRPEFGQMQQDYIVIFFYKGSVRYAFSVTWAICLSPEAGIRHISLYNQTDSVVISEIDATQY